MYNENEMEPVVEQNDLTEDQSKIAIVGGDSAAGRELARKLAALYPLDWKTTEVALADGRYVHVVGRPDSAMILEREEEINQDIAIDKKGGYQLPNPTELEEIDARYYDKIKVEEAVGYKGEVPELHKATVFQSLLERNIYVAENCDVFGDEIRVIEEIGSGDEPDFVIEHTLRGASEAEVKAFRRKNNNRKVERARNGKQKLVQSSQLRPAMDFYDSLMTRLDGGSVGDQPYGDERRGQFLECVNPLVQRAVVKAYIEELTGNLLD